MEIFRTRKELSEYLSAPNNIGKITGLVPTMGALHQGHLSLIEFASKNCDLVICSIFVNPTQFNDARDLEKYPRPIAQDIAKLESAKCDVLFLPEITEMYSGDEKWLIDLGTLDQQLEGELRPGHYQGVTQIVNKFLDVIKPHKAFFGQKDYQQFLVILKMVQILNIPVELVMCPIIRETDGLAMSSRNVHLSADDREIALNLYKSLLNAKVEFPDAEIPDVEEQAKQFLKSVAGLTLEYFSIRKADTLEFPEPCKKSGLIALVAAKAGNTRLIDNIMLS